MHKRVVGVLIGAVLVASFAAGAKASPSHTTPGFSSPHRIDPPTSVADMFQSAASRRAAVGRHAIALPTWTGAFTSAGTTYPYTMVGTDPSAGSVTTTVRVNILPLRFTFDDGGQTLDGSDAVRDVVHSPIFKDADYRSGHTQYGDAMQRASFWDSVQAQSPRYHVLLAQPKILPTMSLEVPAGSGFGYQTANGPAGEVTTPYLFSLAPQLAQFYDPGALLIILTHDVVGDSFWGFHFAFAPAGQTVPLTLIFAAYTTPNVVTPPIESDAYVLSHEVQEWINDPYVTNSVPPWRDPASGVCFNNLLEVGDPVEFLPTPSFTVQTNGNTYHVTDAAGISWFAHDIPSRELGGAYSYDGNLTAFNALC